MMHQTFRIEAGATVAAAGSEGTRGKERRMPVGVEASEMSISSSWYGNRWICRTQIPMYILHSIEFSHNQLYQNQRALIVMSRHKRWADIPAQCEELLRGKTWLLE